MGAMAAQRGLLALALACCAAAGCAGLLLLPPSAGSLQGRSVVEPACAPLHAECARYCWPGVSLTVAFTRSTRASFLLLPDANFYEVLLDGALVANVTNASRAVVSLALDPHRAHVAVLRRRTECQGVLGDSVVFGLEVDDGAASLAPPPPAKRRIELIGDSLTCGYGTLGLMPCHWSPTTEDVFATAGVLTANAVGADVFIEVRTH